MNSLYAVSVRNVDFSYGGRKVLSDLSLEVRAGERVCLSAASGAGKTTLLRLICGLEKPSAGEISVNGEVFCLFQEDRLIPNRKRCGQHQIHRGDAGTDYFGARRGWAPGHG